MLSVMEIAKHGLVKKKVAEGLTVRKKLKGILPQ